MARTGQAYSTAIADSINAFLKEDEWRFDFDSERGRFIFNLGLSCKLKSVRYIVDVREKDYLIYVFSPLGPDKGDAATMKRTAEFLTRANYGLVFGNFEMDMHDGEIRYKTFVPCGGEAPCADVIRRSIYVPAMMLASVSPLSSGGFNTSPIRLRFDLSSHAGNGFFDVYQQTCGEQRVRKTADFNITSAKAAKKRNHYLPRQMLPVSCGRCSADF